MPFISKHPGLSDLIIFDPEKDVVIEAFDEDPDDEPIRSPDGGWYFQVAGANDGWDGPYETEAEAESYTIDNLEYSALRRWQMELTSNGFVPVRMKLPVKNSAAYVLRDGNVDHVITIVENDEVRVFEAKVETENTDLVDVLGEKVTAVIPVIDAEYIGLNHLAVRKAIFEVSKKTDKLSGIHEALAESIDKANAFVAENIDLQMSPAASL